MSVEGEKRDENLCQRKSKTVKRKWERYGFVSADANLDSFNLHGQQSQIKCFSQSSNLLFNQLLTLESPGVVVSERTGPVFSLPRGQCGSV